MKKVLSALLATSMMLTISATAFAAPQLGEDNSLKNTVTGFEGGKKAVAQDITLKEGRVDIPFDLGENASYYEVDIDIKEGRGQVSAEYNKTKKAIVLRPGSDIELTGIEEYEIEIEVLDRETLDTIADGFSINGEVSYDNLQYVDDNHRYKNSKGVIYDFEDGASDVQIDLGQGITLHFEKTPTGVLNLDVTDERNDSIDYMFSKHELEYLTFASKTELDTPVEVTIETEEEGYLYEYAAGRLRRIPSSKYEENVGYVFETSALGSFIFSNMPLTEGIVNEQMNLIRPEGSTSVSTPSTDKNNPTTGAPEIA